AMMAAGYGLAPTITDLLNQPDVESVRFLASLLGALTGYVVGGAGGRAGIRGVDRAESRMHQVEAGVLVAAVIGAVLGATMAFALLWPTLLLPARRVTLPLAMVVAIGVTYLGGRVGAARAGDLARFVGVRGRLEVRSPSRGDGVKVVDTSALIDGRLVEVARAGFLEGTLVVPQFVVYEMQGLADAEDLQRRERGRRGLDVLKTLQDDRRVGIEISGDEASMVSDVDAKLVKIAVDRVGALITVDANLARVAEVSGVRVLNLHRLAMSLRPPVVPGQRIGLVIVKEGRESGQGVGYLEDGTMVVVEGGAAHCGGEVTADVTSMTQNRNGRMLFATWVES
ncbi:MAG: hypothetical protein ACI867_001611, partial [Glaciecola sp.]